MLDHLQAENGLTPTKLAEQIQLQQTQVQPVMTKGPKKVEVGKRLAEYNHRKREELAKAQKLTSGHYYGVIVAIVELGILSYCI